MKTKRRTAAANNRVQVHCVRFRMADIPHKRVTREELGTKWPLGDVPFVIVAYGSTRPGGRRDRMRAWDHTGFFSYITPDGREHGFKTGHEQSRFSALLKEAKSVARFLQLHGSRANYGHDVQHVSTTPYRVINAPRNLAP
jgi:hypothetical protein